MSTLYIRDVPDEVTRTLKARAEAEGMSLSAYVTTQLSRLAAQPTNAEIAARLRVADRSAGPGAGEIVDAVRAARR